MSKKMSQLEDNLSALDVKWTDSELEAIAEKSAPPDVYPNWMLRLFART